MKFTKRFYVETKRGHFKTMAYAQSGQNQSCYVKKLPEGTRIMDTLYFRSVRRSDKRDWHWSGEVYNEFYVLELH